VKYTHLNRNVAVVLAITIVSTTWSQSGWGNRRGNGRGEDAWGNGGQSASITYRGRDLAFDRNEQPFWFAEMIYVPVRAVAGRIGASMDRSDRGDFLQIAYEGRTATYRKGDSRFQINGRTYDMSRPSRDRYDVMFVPIRFFEVLTSGQISARSSWGRPSDEVPRNDRPGGGWGRPGTGDDDWRDHDHGPNEPANVRIVFNGRILRFDSDTEPYSARGIVFLPLRAVADLTEIRIDREDNGRDVILRRGRDQVTYRAGSTNYLFNNRPRALRAPSQSRRGVLFVPVDLFEALLGSELRIAPQGVRERWNDGRNR
jgi:hypothetical protein